MCATAQIVASEIYVHRASFVRIIGNVCSARAQLAQMVPKMRTLLALYQSVMHAGGLIMCVVGFHSLSSFWLLNQPSIITIN